MTAASIPSAVLHKLAEYSLVVARDVITTPDASEDSGSSCSATNDYDGRMGARISSIFVILVAGSFGALFPIVSSNISKLNVPPICFFIAKYFGSGVIVATSLIHLLQPANEALTDPCLNEAWLIYPYAYGIALVSLFSTFFVELVSRRYLERRGIVHTHGDTGFEHEAHTHDPEAQLHDENGVRRDAHADPSSLPNTETGTLASPSSLDNSEKNTSDSRNPQHSNANNSTRYFVDEFSDSEPESVKDLNLSMQLGSIFILEFGIIFHSVFVGLSLAVSGTEFTSLYIVLVFHQLFEGLGLGTRIAVAPWPHRKRWMPWALGIAFGLTTPIAIAIGLGVRQSYPPGSARALITNGIFDSISAGILLYVGLVELVGNEFMHNEEVRRGSTAKVLFAYLCMMAGAGLMALLGRWA